MQKKKKKPPSLRLSMQECFPPLYKGPCSSFLPTTKPPSKQISAELQSPAEIEVEQLPKSNQNPPKPPGRITPNLPGKSVLKISPFRPLNKLIFLPDF